MNQPETVVEVTAQDLQGPGVVACPNPKMVLWSSHPRVFIDVATITSAGFASVEERFNDLDVKAQLKAFERKFQKLEEALHIKL